MTMNLWTRWPAVAVILLLAGFFASFVWRLYIGPGDVPEDRSADERSGIPPA